MRTLPLLAFALACDGAKDTGTASPYPTTIDASECKGSGLERSVSADTAGIEADPALAVEAAGGVLFLRYTDVVANCCPSPGAEVSVDGGALDVNLIDVTADESCDCACVFDFDVQVKDLPAGDYSLTGRYLGTTLFSGAISL